MTARADEIEIADDPRFDRRMIVVQRIAWVVMFTLVVGALLGVFGRGPASWATVSSADGRLVVRYERFLRADAQSDLHIELSDVREGPWQVAIDADYLNRFRIVQVEPTPASVASADGRRVFRFETAGSPIGPLVAEFTLSPRGAGRLRATVGGGHGGAGVDSAVTFAQFAWP